MSHADDRHVGSRATWQILSPDQIRTIHETSLEILAEVGITLHSRRALDIVAEHGGEVDYESTVARLSPELVEKALASLPASITLGARDPQYELPFDGEHVFLSTDGCGVFRREFDGTVRPSCKQDLYEAARIAQAMPNVSSTSAVVSAQDCPPETRVLHEFDACVRGSAKHSIVVSIKEDWEARSLMRMGEAIAGGSRELAEKPVFTCIICTVSPLHQERFGMDLALTLAAGGIPVSFYPMPILGATAPATIAGAAAVNNAELISAAAVVQLAFPGAKVLHGGGPTAMSMSSGAYASNSPEALLLRAVQGQMADFYGLPAWFGAGATTAKEPGVQSAYENALAMMCAYSAGADCTFGTGLLDGSRILALEQIVTDNEVFGIVTRLLRGVDVSAETLAVDLVKKMGFRGDYLFDGHTRRHARELWQAQLGETGTYDSWLQAGGPATVEKARQTVHDILAAEPEPFPEELGHELDRIIATTRPS
jgi:trimethylamine--corrinoid protein Co-methyltransferase